MSETPKFEAHNQSQRAYFERGIKKTMIPGNTPYILQHIERLTAFGGLTQNDLLLDVGCGMGRYTIPMAEQGYRLEGLDLSPVLIDQLRAYDAGRFNIPLYAMDLLQRPPELKAKYDAIIGFFTLHHLHDLTASYEAMKYYVRPGGQILFIEPNAYCPLYPLQITFSRGMTWEGDGGVMKMRRGLLQKAITSAGLTNFRLERFGILPPAVRNQSYGAELEHAIERVPGIKPILAFQLIGATVP